MKLLTKANLRSLPALYSTEEIEDKIIPVKFFDPTGSWTWYAAEYDPESEMFFGLVDGFEREWGYFTLAELKSVKGRFGLGIERDMYWQPKKVSEIRGT